MSRQPWSDLGLAASAAEEEQVIEPFDHLPDPILLVILNRIGDVKTLARCCVVSRRFRSLAPLVDDVSFRIDRVISEADDTSMSSLSSSSSSAPSPDKARRSVLSRFAHLLFSALAPRMFSSSSKRSSYAESSSSQASHRSPKEVLKNFKEIRRLRIELPVGELGVGDGVLLKWKAGFGSTIDNCVILGASSKHEDPPSPAHDHDHDHDLCAGEENGSIIAESFYANGGLKLRVVWTISSLIAASARHNLLQSIIGDHELLEFLDLTDADGQGVLTMSRRQLQELRVRPPAAAASASGSSQRTLMPALCMKLWYAPLLETPCGMVLKGATLVAICPCEERLSDMGPSDFPWVLDAFEEPYRTAASMLIKRRSYNLEMNSF